MGNSCKILSHVCNPHLNFNALPHVAFVFLQMHRMMCYSNNFMHTQPFHGLSCRSCYLAQSSWYTVFLGFSLLKSN